MRRSRFAVMSAVCAVCVLGAVVGCSSSPTSTSAKVAPAKFTPITVAYPVQVSDFMLAPFTAAMGYFKKEGLTVNIKVIPSTELPAAITSGAVQFTITGPPQIELAALKGVPVQEIADYGIYCNNYLLAGPGIKTVADLKGHTVGASSPTALSTILLEYALLKNNVPLSAVHIIPNGTEPDASFISGNVDAFVVSPPENEVDIAGRPGSSLIYNYDKLAWPHEISGYVPFMQKNKAETLAFLKAMNLGLEAWRSHEATAVSVIEKAANITNHQTAVATYQSNNTYYLKKLASPSVSVVNGVYKVLALVGAGPKDYTGDAQKLVNTSYFKQADLG